MSEPAAHLRVVSDTTWEPPTPLGASSALPPFPADTLPDWVGDYANAVATETQTPLDLPACIGLAALSTAAGGRVTVQVRGTWSEPVNIFTVVAMPPGSRKSAVFRAMTRPILDIERDLAEHTRPVIEAARVERAIAEERAAKARKSAVSAGTDHASAAEQAATAAAEVEAITVPTIPRLVADDVTPEKTASLIAEHGGRIAVLSAEGGIISTLAGRYSNAPNYDVFLKGHAGDTLRVDRQGRPPEHVDAPALTLGLAIQPEVLRDIAKVPGGRGKGLLGRILYALPDDLVGRRTIGPPAVPEHLTTTYATNLHTLVRVLAEWTEPARLLLTQEAEALILDLEEETEPRLAPGNQWSHARDWYSKWVGSIVRIAALLHLAHHTTDGWRHPITSNTLIRATEIGRYFADHALAVYDHMGADPLIDNARTILSWIQHTQPTSFTSRDAHRACQSSIRAADDIRAALELLTDHGHIRQTDNTQGDRPRRGRKPSPTYLTHPMYHDPKDCL